MRVVEANMGGSCFSNKLEVYDDTGDAPLKYPGLAAQCGQSSFPPATRSISSEGVLTVKFTMGERDENVRFKILVEATQPECPPADPAVGCLLYTSDAADE